jgi:hypothetical protein
VKHPVACLAATAALAAPPVTTGILPAEACDALIGQALPALATASPAFAQLFAPPFMAFCTPTPVPPGAVAWTSSSSWDLLS